MYPGLGNPEQSNNQKFNYGVKGYDMSKQAHLKQLIIQVVNNQLRAKDPPETKETCDRLVAEGYSRQEAKELIAAVVATHIYTVLNDQTMFDKALYVRQLKELPK